MRRPLAVVVAAACALAASGVVALPEQAGAAPAGQVVVVGDSITKGAASAIPAAMPSRPVVVDARECRATAHDATYAQTGGACRGSVPSGATVVRTRRAEIGDVLVVQLGANDAGSATAFRAAAESLLAEARGVRTVLWLTIAEVRPTFVAANQVLRDLAATHPNLRIVDWAAIAATPGYVVGDGLHLRAPGATALAQLIASAVTTSGPSCAAATNPYPATPSSRSGRGYWLLDSTGKVWGYDAPTFGDLTTVSGDGAPVAITGTATGQGYWIVDANGRVFAFGDAARLGDVRSLRLNAPVISMALTPDQSGYWLLARDGGVFSFGSAQFLGSLGNRRLNAPVISGTATATGRGYYLIAADGGVFTFGDSTFRGSMGDRRLNAPVVAMAIDPMGRGYWLYAADGGVFTFGDVAFHGSIPGFRDCSPPKATVAMRPSGTGRGYWVVGDAGEVFAFGDAVDHGDRPALAPGATVLDLAVRQ